MALAQYEIIVKRLGHKGKLIFSHGDIAVDTTCWWDPKVVVEANPDGYVCYVTRMNTKKDSVTKEKRPGIWFGKGVKYAHGTKSSNGIFIHEGTNADWSDGCIVAARNEVMKIWNAIHPQGDSTVLVKVTDEKAGA
jgi:hypothetical protein